MNNLPELGEPEAVSLDKFLDTQAKRLFGPTAEYRKRKIIIRDGDNEYMVSPNKLGLRGTAGSLAYSLHLSPDGWAINGSVPLANGRMSGELQPGRVGLRYERSFR